MNLIEAIKSGKPFKRKDETGFYKSADFSSCDQDPFWSVSDVLADDWEIKQEPREWWLTTDGQTIYTTHDRPINTKILFPHTDCQIIKVREVL